MSHSGSRTPTHSPAISNIIKSPQSTTSRPQILDDTPSEHLFEDRVRLPVTPPSLEPQIAESSSRRTAPESPTEQPMAKRIRRESPETRGRTVRHPSSSSDSQAEMVVEKVDRPAAATTSPPKKKRTRTLTTPQQSAVLHALLAKSRFPTTAMREDVGRSIGLSARKVQIWFQNQRQKARRPRSQSDAPLTRPPQYGPFPNPPGSNTRGFEGHPTGHHMSYAAQSTSPEAQSSQSDTQARLLGPGMPGPTVYAPHPYHPIPGPSSSASPIQPRFPGTHTARRSESPQYHRPPHAPSHVNVRSTISQAGNWHQRDPLRTLPPLLPTRTSTYSTRRAHSPSPYMPSRFVHGPPRPMSPDPRFVRISPEITSRPSMSLPPPFAIQPSPQWNQASYQPVQRPIWSRTDSRSTIERLMPAVTTRRERTMGPGGSIDLSEGHRHSERTAPPVQSSSSPLIPSSPSPPPPRPGRYDPVRATFITRPTPTLPRVMSPPHQSSKDNDKEIREDRKPHTSPRENR